MENEVKYSEEIEKVINRKNTDCLLCGTKECEFLNMENCSECPVGNLKKENQEKTAKALGRLMEAVPQEEIETLYTSDTCLFCKGGDKGETECFALFDAAKRDPEGDWTIAFGKKRVGMKGPDMILPLQVSCCKKCRSRFRTADILPTITAILIAAAGLIITTNSSIYKIAYERAAWMPAAMMACFIAIAFAGGYLMRRLMLNSFSKRTHMRASDIPEVRRIFDRGFEEVQPAKKGMSAFVFSNERREHGVGSLVTGRALEPDPGDDVQICGIWPADTGVIGKEDEPEEEAPEEAPEENTEE